MNGVLWLWAGLTACGLWGPSEPTATVAPDEADVTEETDPAARRRARRKRDRVRVKRAEAIPEGPNILLIVWDTARADRMSMYGYDKPTTPRMDAWAAEHALVFERAISPGVWTLPSHASLFTGLPSRTHGVDASNLLLASRFETVPKMLETSGYDTYAFCANPYIGKHTGLLDGFGSVERPWSRRWRTAVASHMDDKILEEDGSTPVSPQWPEHKVRNKYLFKEAGPVAQMAVSAWLEERDEPERPWFAFVNYMEAHLPRIPSLEARVQVMSPAEIARSFLVAQDTENFHAWMAGVRDYEPLDLAALSGVYDASLIDLDKATAELLEGLAKAGMLDNTIVVITSDHGEHLGEHHLLLHKYGVYRELSRVPLLVSWPGHIEPGRSVEPFSVADILPWVLAKADIPVTDSMAAQFAQRPSAMAVPGVVTEFNAINDGQIDKLLRGHPGVDTARFLYTFKGIELGRHKLIERSDDTIELYDVLSDPAEQSDVAGSDGTRTEDMKAALEAWRQAVPPFSAQAGDEGARELSDELREGLQALGYTE